MNIDPTEGKTYKELANEYPKIAMMIEYVTKHYPDDIEAISKNKMISAAVMSSNYSNNQIEDIIDKLAIFNGWKKWEPKT